jgi:hypothetical protein
VVRVKLPETYRTERGFTVEGAGPELLADLLDAYEFEIRRRSPEAWVSAKPGLAVEEVVELMSSAGLPVPDEAIVWWSWGNGHRLDRTWRMRFPQMSLETAIENYGIDRDQYNLALLPGPQWIRVAGIDRSAAIGIDCDPSYDLPLVRLLDPELGNGPARLTDRQAVSLCTPVTWWLTAIAKGWMEFDHTGFWRVRDLDAYPTEWRLTNLI